MKSIKGFPGYSLKRNGVVISFLKDKKGRVLKPALSSNGYMVVQLWKDGKANMKFVHRLMAETYLKNPENLPIVNHKNGVKTDNFLANLEWCTRSHNNVINYVKGISKRKLHVEEVKEIISLLHKGEKPSDLGRRFGVNRSMITNIKKNRTWKHLTRPKGLN